MDKNTNKALLPMLACLTSLAACAEVPKSQPTDEEREKIQKAIDSLDLVVELTKDIVALADPEKLADKNGGEGSVEEFQEGIHDAHETVLDLWKDERIFTYNPADVQDENSFLDDPTVRGFFGTDIEGEFMAIARKDGEWIPTHGILAGVLIHEGAHRYMGHTEEINDLIEAGKVQIYGLCDAAIKSDDFPMELSCFTFPAEKILDFAHSDLWRMRKDLEEAAQANDWEEVDSLMEGADPFWLSALLERDDLFGTADILGKFGVDKEKLREMIGESDLYKDALEQYAEGVEEIYEELTEARDAQSEVKREMMPGARR
jgi:hypothetical protein